MRGLMIKDCFVVRRSIWVFLLLAVWFIVWGFILKDSVRLLFILPVFVPMLVITTCSYDDRAKWNAYALSMPFSRRDIVLSKYMVLLIIALLSEASALLIAVFTCVIRQQPITANLILWAPASFGIGLTAISIMLPLIYRFGTEKAGLMMFLVYFIPSVLPVLLSQIGFAIQISRQLTQTLMIVLPIGAFAVFIFSYLISKSIFLKKEL